MPAPLMAPAGWRLAAPAELRAWPDLFDAQVLYQWPLEGWVQGRGRSVCKRAGFLHVVGYAAASSLGAMEANSLLDVALHWQAGRRPLASPTANWPARCVGVGAGPLIRPVRAREARLWN